MLSLKICNKLRLHFEPWQNEADFYSWMLNFDPDLNPLLCEDKTQSSCHLHDHELVMIGHYSYGSDTAPPSTRPSVVPHELYQLWWDCPRQMDRERFQTFLLIHGQLLLSPLEIKKKIILNIWIFLYEKKVGQICSQYNKNKLLLFYENNF